MVFSIKNIDEIAPETIDGSFLNATKDNTFKSMTKDQLSTSMPFAPEGDSGAVPRSISDNASSMLNDYRGEEIKLSVSNYGAKKHSFQSIESGSSASSNNYS